MKIAYFGYDFFADCLEYVLKRHEVLRVYSFQADNKYNFNDRVIDLIGDQPIPLQFGKVTSDNIRELEVLGCELVISAAYPYKIPVSTDVKGINIHPTLLPEGRGPWPLPYVIINRLTRSGVTIHKLTDAMDSGEILLQREFLVTENENLESLSCKCQMAATPLLAQLLDHLEDYWQNANSQSEGSYWPFPSDAEQTINWNDPVSDIERKIRAYGKLESMAAFDGKAWVIRDAVAWQESHTKKIGTVVHRTHGEVVIAALDGFVCIRDFGLDRSVNDDMRN